MIDLERVLESLGIEYHTSGKNNISGCYTFPCPMCDDHSRTGHGNANPETGSYKCWRCKGASLATVLTRKSGKSYAIVKKLLDDNTTGSTRVRKEKEYAKELAIVGGTSPLPIQVNYLRSRGLDPANLELYYGIRYGRLGESANGINVSLRIIIPVLDEYGTPIAWQARDTTGKSDFRYVFPRSSECLDDSKKHLYGAHLCRERKRIVVVEGVFDCWKLGGGACCTFGTSVTDEQILAMANWEEVVIAFDHEVEAQEHALDIARKLECCGTSVYIADTDFGYNDDGTARDLGDCSADEIVEFRKQCGI